VQQLRSRIYETIFIIVFNSLPIECRPRSFFGHLPEQYGTWHMAHGRRHEAFFLNEAYITQPCQGDRS
jgi:hypothetical protein